MLVDQFDVLYEEGAEQGRLSQKYADVVALDEALAYVTKCRDSRSPA
jgi:hypothetical protein